MDLTYRYENTYECYDDHVVICVLKNDEMSDSTKSMIWTSQINMHVHMRCVYAFMRLWGGLIFRNRLSFGPCPCGGAARFPKGPSLKTVRWPLPQWPHLCYDDYVVICALKNDDPRDVTKIMVDVVIRITWGRVGGLAFVRSFEALWYVPCSLCMCMYVCVCVCVRVCLWCVCVYSCSFFKRLGRQCMYICLGAPVYVCIHIIIYVFMHVYNCTGFGAPWQIQCMHVFYVCM